MLLYMTHETNPEISKKLFAFTKKMTSIKKGGYNPHYKSRYAQLHEIQEGMQEALEEVGLIVMQSIEREGLKTIIRDEEGNSEAYMYPMPYASDMTSQAAGSASTYARRYALASIFNLIINDASDDDGHIITDRQEFKQFAMNNKDEVVEWLTKEEYQRALTQLDANQLRLVLENKKRENGNIFGMSKAYRVSLINRLKELENN